MRRFLALGLLFAALAASGCGGDDGDEKSNTSPPEPSPPTETTPERPLPAAWYEDPDEDFMPTAIEEEQGTDPEVNECLEKLDCPGIDSETGLAAAPKERNTLLMLDSSGSMRGPAGGGRTKIQAAKDALGRFVAGTPSQLNLGFLVFGHRGSNQPSGKQASCRRPELLDPIGEVDFRSFRRTLGRFEPRGYTPIARALVEARRAFEGSEDAENRIILVTDGVETCGGKPIEEARKLKRAGIAVTVDVVGFDIGTSGDRERLRRIAKATGGTYTDAQTGDDLDRYFEGQRKRASQLLDAAICVSTKSSDVRVCSDTTVTEASLAMRDLSSEASQAGDDAQADEIDRLRDEMKEAQDAFDDESTEQSDEILDRLRDERRRIEERLRDSAALPGTFASVRPPCRASPFVRTRLLLPRETLLLARRARAAGV